MDHVARRLRRRRGCVSEILVGRLYRETHTSFEAFTEEEFSLQRAHAHRLVNAAPHFHVIGPVAEKRGIPLPQNEAQLRPLAKLEPKEAAEVWTLAAKRAKAEKTPLTAEIVAKEVYRFVTPTDQIERNVDRRRDRRVAAAQNAADRKADQVAPPEPSVAPPQTPVPAAAGSFRDDCTELVQFVRGLAKAYGDRRFQLENLLKHLNQEVRFGNPVGVDQIIAGLGS